MARAAPRLPEWLKLDEKSNVGQQRGPGASADSTARCWVGTAAADALSAFLGLVPALMFS